jgi:hypothetical protein
MISRRNFVRNVAIGAGALYLTGGQAVFGQRRQKGSFFPIPPEAYTDLMYSMTAKQLEGYLGRSFIIVSESGKSYEAILTEVNLNEDLRNTSTGVYGESFSLIFEINNDEVRLVQDVYTVSTPGIQQFSPLIVPTGRRSRQYEVIINHLTR